MDPSPLSKIINECRIGFVAKHASRDRPVTPARVGEMTLTLRKTVIGGETLEDDYTVHCMLDLDLNIPRGIASALGGGQRPA
jgi:hypothetical protein